MPARIVTTENHRKGYRTQGEKMRRIWAKRRGENPVLCIELHCSGRESDHDYGSLDCDWVLTDEGSVEPNPAKNFN